MPRAGVPNNPTGVNNWDGWKQEPQYGEITNTKRLAGASPLAGGRVAAGALNAPKRAGRNAKKKPKPKPPAYPPVTGPPPEGPAPMPPGVGPEPPPGGVFGEPTGVPPWTIEYPPGTIQNYTALRQQILAVRGVDKYPALKYLGRVM